MKTFWRRSHSVSFGIWLLLILLTLFHTPAFAWVMLLIGWLPVRELIIGLSIHLETAKDLHTAVAIFYFLASLVFLAIGAARMRAGKPLALFLAIHFTIVAVGISSIVLIGFVQFGYRI